MDVEPAIKQGKVRLWLDTSTAPEPLNAVRHHTRRIGASSNDSGELFLANAKGDAGNPLMGSGGSGEASAGSPEAYMADHHRDTKVE